MNKFIEMVTTYWPTIIEYAVVFLSYFLTFLYRARVNGTRLNLTTLCKATEKDIIDSVNNKVLSLDNTYDTIEKAYIETKQAYLMISKKCETLQNDIIALQEILLNLTEGENTDEKSGET